MHVMKHLVSSDLNNLVLWSESYAVSSYKNVKNIETQIKKLKLKSSGISSGTRLMKEMVGIKIWEQTSASSEQSTNMCTL